jgi:hypothetical protein
VTAELAQRQDSPIGRAMLEAYQRVRDGEQLGRFACPSGCGGTVQFGGDPSKPHITAGSCTTARCLRWAVPK